MDYSRQFRDVHHYAEEPPVAEGMQRIYRHTEISNGFSGHWADRPMTAFGRHRMILDAHPDELAKREHPGAGGVYSLDRDDELTRRARRVPWQHEVKKK